MSALSNSGARLPDPANSLCARRVTCSTRPSRFNTHGFCERSSQPARATAPADATARERNLRRLSLGSAIAFLRFDGIAACDDGPQIVQGAGEHDHDHMREEEGDEGERA